MEIEKDVKRAKKGDREAFSRLIREHQQLLYRVSFSILRSDQDCADAIQEAILKAYDGIGQLREPKYFKTWLTRIVMNECYQLIRRSKKVVPFEKLAESGQVDRAYERIELEEAVQNLSEENRLVILLFYFEDLPLKDIAELVACPLGTVKSRLNRARRELEAMLEIDEEEGGVDDESTR